MGPRVGLDGYGKFRPPTAFDRQTVQMYNYIFVTSAFVGKVIYNTFNARNMNSILGDFRLLPLIKYEMRSSGLFPLLAKL